MGLWIQFAILTGIIFFAGSNLSRYGDVIAEKTGMGRVWVGVALIASVTSLPELFTGVSSVVVFDLPNIAVGDVLGSCMFNVLIIALMDVPGGPIPISHRVEQKQVLAAGFGILMLSVAAMGIAVGPALPTLGWIGPYSLVFLFLYFIAMRSVFLLEKHSMLNGESEKTETDYDDIPLRTAYRNYALNAVLVAAAATYLPSLGEEIAIVTGLGQTFVGSIFIAFTTSLPEFVVSLAAIRIGAADLMFGNLLGSNIFNMAILGIDDLFYFKGPLLADVTTIHLVTANAAMAMTAVVVISLTYRLGRKVLFFAWDSLAIMAVYMFAVGVMFLMR